MDVSRIEWVHLRRTVHRLRAKIVHCVILVPSSSKARELPDIDLLAWIGRRQERIMVIGGRLARAGRLRRVAV